MNRPPKTQQRKRSLPDGEYRERCYGCYRPVKDCFCDSIPTVQNRTDILILQHQRERSHPFNTARIVNQALDRCNLIFDRNESFSQRALSIAPDAALLYPGKEAELIDELAPQDRPSQLILIDGTWDQAKSLFRDIPQLHGLPQLKLNPSSPGQYRIRREPTATSLSTIEATVQALQQLEPETAGLPEILAAFDTMVRQQLSHPNANYDNPEPPKVETLNVPKSLLRDPSKIVVAYGEATPADCGPNAGWVKFNRRKKEAAKLPPVFWLAQRLENGKNGNDFFVESIQPQTSLTDSGLARMELNRSEFDSAISIPEFRDCWKSFLNEDDLLIVPNDRTIHLLQNCEAFVPDFVSLKSINYDPHGQLGQLSEFLDSVSAVKTASSHRSRAGKRLANAVALATFLRSKAAS